MTRFDGRLSSPVRESSLLWSPLNKASAAPRWANACAAAMPVAPVAPVIRNTRPFMLVHLHRLTAHAFDDRAVALFFKMSLAAEMNPVTRLGGLGLQVEAIIFIGFHHMRNAVVDLNAVADQLLYLFRVVGDQADGIDLQRCEHVSRDRVVALVVTKAQRQVRLDRI